MRVLLSVRKLRSHVGLRERGPLAHGSVPYSVLLPYGLAPHLMLVIIMPQIEDDVAIGVVEPKDFHYTIILKREQKGEIIKHH